MGSSTYCLYVRSGFILVLTEGELLLCELPFKIPLTRTTLVPSFLGVGGDGEQDIIGIYPIHPPRVSYNDLCCRLMTLNHIETETETDENKTSKFLSLSLGFLPKLCYLPTFSLCFTFPLPLLDPFGWIIVAGHVQGQC